MNSMICDLRHIFENFSKNSIKLRALKIEFTDLSQDFGSSIIQGIF